MDDTVQLPADDSFDVLRRNVTKLAATGRSVKCIYTDARSFTGAEGASVHDGFMRLSGKLEVIIDTRQYLVELVDRRAADLEQVLTQMLMLANVPSELAVFKVEWFVSDLCFPSYKFDAGGKLLESYLRILVTPEKVARASNAVLFTGARMLAFDSGDIKRLRQLRRQLVNAS